MNWYSVIINHLHSNARRKPMPGSWNRRSLLNTLRPQQKCPNTYHNFRRIHCKHALFDANIHNSWNRSPNKSPLLTHFCCAVIFLELGLEVQSTNQWKGSAAVNCVVLLRSWWDRNTELYKLCTRVFCTLGSRVAYVGRPPPPAPSPVWFSGCMNQVCS